MNPDEIGGGSDIYEKVTEAMIATSGLEDKFREARQNVLANPEDSSAHSEMGKVFFDMGFEGCYDAAIHYFEKALNINPQNTQALLGLGEVYYHKAEVEDSLENYLEVVRIDPENVQGYVGVGKCYRTIFEETGDPSFLLHAMIHYQKAIPFDAENVSARIGLARCYFAQKRYRRAAIEFEEAKNLAPENADVRRDLGVSYIELGRFDEAETELKKAVEFYHKKCAFEEKAKALFYLSLANRGQGKEEEALKNLETAVILFPAVIEIAKQYSSDITGLLAL